MKDKQDKNVIRGKLVSPKLHAEAPGAAEARVGEGGFRNKAIHGRSHTETAESHPKHSKGY